MKRNTLIIAFAIILTTVITITSCVSTKVAAKTGDELWSENCQRCHNSPPRSAYSNIQWEVINTHMRQCAILTEDEYKKITEFYTH
jgi:hypothetical protein